MIGLFKQQPVVNRDSAPAAPAALPRATQSRSAQPPLPPPPPPPAYPGAQYGGSQGSDWSAVMQQQQQPQQAYGQQQWPAASGYPMQPQQQPVRLLPLSCLTFWFHEFLTWIVSVTFNMSAPPHCASV